MKSNLSEYSAKNNWYREAGLKITDRRFMFMNHGYLGPEGLLLDARCYQRFSSQIYSANLVAMLLSRLDCEQKAVLDVGCGRAGSCRVVKELYNTSALVGMDISAWNILSSRDLRNSSELTAVLADAQKLPWISCSFDVILCIESFHCYPRGSDFFREAMRVLRPGGHLLVADGGTPKDAERIVEQAVEIGFCPVSFEDVSLGVLGAIERGRESMREFFEDMSNKGTGEAKFLDRLFQWINGPVAQGFRDQSLIYWSANFVASGK